MSLDDYIRLRIADAAKSDHRFNRGQESVRHHAEKQFRQGTVEVGLDEDGGKPL